MMYIISILGYFLLLIILILIFLFRDKIVKKFYAQKPICITGFWYNNILQTSSFILFLGYFLFYFNSIEISPVVLVLALVFFILPFISHYALFQNYMYKRNVFLNVKYEYSMIQQLNIDIDKFRSQYYISYTLVLHSGSKIVLKSRHTLFVSDFYKILELMKNNGVQIKNNIQSDHISFKKLSPGDQEFLKSLES